MSDEHLGDMSRALLLGRDDKDVANGERAESNAPSDTPVLNARNRSRPCVDARRRVVARCIKIYPFERYLLAQHEKVHQTTRARPERAHMSKRPRDARPARRGRPDGHPLRLRRLLQRWGLHDLARGVSGRLRRRLAPVCLTDAHERACIRRGVPALCASRPYAEDVFAAVDGRDGVEWATTSSWSAFDERRGKVGHGERLGRRRDTRALQSRYDARAIVRGGVDVGETVKSADVPSRRHGCAGVAEEIAQGAGAGFFETTIGRSAWDDYWMTRRA